MPPRINPGGPVAGSRDLLQPSPSESRLNMPGVEFLESARWPVQGLPLAALGVSLEVLAERLDATIYTWHEDGLGDASGFGGRTPGVPLFLLEELDHEVKAGAAGPTLYADAADIASKGVEPLLGEILAGLGLTRADVIGVAGAALREFAAKRVAEVAPGGKLPGTGPAADNLKAI